MWCYGKSAKGLACAMSMVKREKDEAAAAVASAIMSAAKAEDILGSFTSEIANARHNSVQFQVCLGTSCQRMG